MGGFFGVVSGQDCVADLFYGTDYHSHLGTQRGGMVVNNGNGFTRSIHNITNAQFRSKFEDDLPTMHGTMGLGIISDYEDQPLVVSSHLGTYSIVTVGRVHNLEQLTSQLLGRNGTHFTQIRDGEINPTELVTNLIDGESTFQDGISHAQSLIDGSCSLLILDDKGIVAARDRLGRTPVTVGRKDGAQAVTMETSALSNLGYEVEHLLGPGEVVRVTADGIETLLPPGQYKICHALHLPLESLIIVLNLLVTIRDELQHILLFCGETTASSSTSEHISRTLPLLVAHLVVFFTGAWFVPRMTWTGTSSSILTTAKASARSMAAGASSVLSSFKLITIISPVVLVNPVGKRLSAFAIVTGQTHSARLSILEGLHRWLTPVTREVVHNLVIGAMWLCLSAIITTVPMLGLLRFKAYPSTC